MMELTASDMRYQVDGVAIWDAMEEAQNVDGERAYQWPGVESTSTAESVSSQPQRQVPILRAGISMADSTN